MREKNEHQSNINNFFGKAEGKKSGIKTLENRFIEYKKDKGKNFNSLLKSIMDIKEEAELLIKKEIYFYGEIQKKYKDSQRKEKQKLEKIREDCITLIDNIESWLAKK
jgi:hypothetical protein